MSFIKDNLIPVTLAVLMHVLLLMFLIFSVDWSPKQESQKPPENIINAVVIDETKIRAEQEKKRQAEAEKKRNAEQEKKRKAAQEKKRQAEADKKSQAKLEKKRKAEAEKKRQAKLEKKRKAEVEKKRQAKLEKKRKDEVEKKRQAKLEKKRKAEAEKKRQAKLEKKRQEKELKRQEEEEFQRQLDEEQQDILDSAAQRKLGRQSIAYKSAIQRDVQQAWRKAPGTKSGMSCVVSVKQIPGGEVVDVNIINCNTDDANFRRSVMNAVYKASPLPRPADSTLFERELEFSFTPQE